MLTDEQVFEVNEFFNSEAWTLLFARIQSHCIHEWLGSNSMEDREELWRQMQAVMTLHAALRDAPATKAMDQRNQQRRYQS
jgi:hypothetical protein